MISPKRLDALQPFFPQSNEQAVVLKPDPFIRTIHWVFLLVLIPTELFFACALMGLLIGLGSEVYPLQIWILVILANLGCMFLIIVLSRLILSPNYQMLTLDKDQITAIGYLKRTQTFYWKDITKFETRHVGRTIAIDVVLKSITKAEQLTVCYYDYKGLNIPELMEILNLWLERYGTLTR